MGSDHTRLLEIYVYVWISNPNRFQFNTFIIEQINVLIFSIILEFGLVHDFYGVFLGNPKKLYIYTYKYMLILKKIIIWIYKEFYLWSI